eukprot:127598-Ditylum_brightwellii.AAC.1
MGLPCMQEQLLPWQEEQGSNEVLGGIYYPLTKLGDIAYDCDMNTSSVKRQTQFVLLWLARVI